MTGNSNAKQFGDIKEIKREQIKEMPPQGQVFDISKIAKVSHEVAIIQREHEEERRQKSEEK